MIKVRYFYLCLIVVLMLSACQANNIDMMSTPTTGITRTSDHPITETITLTPVSASSTPRPTNTQTNTPTPFYTATPVTSSDCRQMEAVQHVTPTTAEEAWNNAYWEGKFHPMEAIIATIPLTIADQLSPEEFITAMFCAYLENYHSTSIEFSQRLDDFRIDSVSLHDYPNQDFPNDFTATIWYSVLPSIYQSYWMAGNGTSSNDDWIINKVTYVEIQRNIDNYIMAYPHTGP